MEKTGIIKAAMAAGAFLALTACVSPEQQAAMMEAQRQADSAECQRLGFQPGSGGFGNCMLKLKEIRAQEDNTRAIDRARMDSYDPWWGYPYGPYRRHYW